MSVATAEQETTINWSRNEEGATIWTSDSTVMTKLDRLCREAPENWNRKATETDRNGDVVSKMYVLSDKGLISFRKARMKLSDEAREARSHQFARFSQ